MIQWPGMDWCTTVSGAGSFDPRFRPWYATAASGPKDLILILDRSASMTATGIDRWKPVQFAAGQVLKTLWDTDFATVIAFSTVATVYDGKELLHSVTTQQRKKMITWIDEQSALGGTNFESGFAMAKRVFAASLGANPPRSSNCVQAILFLTDGRDSKGFQLSSLDTGLEGVVVFTYSVGDDADNTVPKQIACKTNGIWNRIADNNLAAVADTMASYFQLFAASIDSTVPRWNEYADSVSGVQLLASCLPVYDRSGSTKNLAGVVCMDMNVVIDLPTFKAKPGYATVAESMRSASTSCPVIHQTAATMQRLRREAAGDDGVCTENDMRGIPNPTTTSTPPAGDPSASRASRAMGPSRDGCVFARLLAVCTCFYYSAC